MMSIIKTPTSIPAMQPGPHPLITPALEPTVEVARTVVEGSVSLVEGFVVTKGSVLIVGGSVVIESSLVVDGSAVEVVDGSVVD